MTIGGRELSTVKESALLQNVTLVSLGSHLFKGTVADNLRMAAPTADDAALWAVLEQVRLADFLRSENGLDTQLNEGGSVWRWPAPCCMTARSISLMKPRPISM